MEAVEDANTWKKPLLGATELIGLVVVILMGVWTGHFRNGFAWQDDPAHEFNWHPLLMTIGLIFLLGNNILVFRIFTSWKHNTLKLIHSGTHVGVFVFFVVALQAVFDSHNLNTTIDEITNSTIPKPIPNMYSLHSWMGIITVLLFAMQWMAGFILFLLPEGIHIPPKINQFSLQYKAFYMSIHLVFGILIFVLACTTALLGITEKMIFGKEYSEMNPEGMMVNAMGIFIILFGFLVVYLVTNYEYKLVQIERAESIYEKPPRKTLYVEDTVNLK